MKRLSLFSFAVIGLLIPCHLSAVTVSLKGTVKTGSGSGIEGVAVKLAKDNSISATTDAQGAFSIVGEIGVGVDRSLLSEKPHYRYSLQVHQRGYRQMDSVGNAGVTVKRCK